MVLLLLIPDIITLTALSFEYNIESFFSDSDKNVDSYKDFKSVFGNENDELLIGVKHQKEIDKTFINEVDQLIEELKNHDFVRFVESPALINCKIKVPFLGFVTKELINKESDSTFRRDLETLNSRNHPFQNFISAHALSVQLILNYSPDLTDHQSTELLSTIKNTLKKFSFFE